MPLRAARKMRSIYLDDEDYKRFRTAAAEQRLTFSDWARLAMDSVATKTRRPHKAEKPVEAYKGPNGWIWEKNLQCWCGECHDPFATHGENTMEMDVEGRHAPKLGAKPCNVETSSV